MIWASLLLFTVSPAQHLGREKLQEYFSENHWKRDERTNDPLPKRIKIGASSSAFKIEVSWNVDGKGESIWDRWVNEQYNETFENHHIACNSYKTPELDVEALTSIGAQSYRFSIAWSRIFPTGGSNGPNQAGIDYYKNLVDMLVGAGIEPIVTLFDWDLPSSLQDEFDGFLSDNIVSEFRSYAEVVFEALSANVKTFVTINEPYSYCTFGHIGLQPPALSRPEDGALLCGHNVLRAHASVAKLYHEKYSGRTGQIGLNLEATWSEPKIWSEEKEVDAAWRMMQFNLGWFIHPLVYGDYPGVIKQYVNENRVSMQSDVRMPEFTSEEINAIKGSADFVGLNYKASYIARKSDDYNATESVANLGSMLGDSRAFELPDWRDLPDQTGQSQDPWGLRRLMGYLEAEYGSLELAVEFTGAFKHEYNDADKIAYLDAHLNQLTRAQDETDHTVKHVFIQSLTDGFEWSNQYEYKYGLFHVDFMDNNRPRTVKRSGQWLKNFIQQRTFENDKKETMYGRFEPSFKFGAMTSSYQHENAIDGSRDFALWDIQGIRGPHRTADILKHIDDDVQLLKKLKLKTYGLSLAWGRVFRYTSYNETSVPDQDVIDIYRYYLTKLNAAGIEPVVTLYNWDMPRIVLRDFGGWRSPSRPRDWSGRKAFVHYAKACFEAFGDLVPYWVTFQEPQRELMLSYEENAAPPEFPVNLPGRQVYENAKNMLMAHAEAKAEFDKMGLKGKFGITLATDIGLPFDFMNAKDIEAANRYNAFSIDWLLSPLLTGDWPEVMKQSVGDRLDAFTSQESSLLKGSLDFLGAMHKTHKLITYREPQKDITPQSFDKDRNVEMVANFDSRKTSAAYQRVTKSGRPVRLTLSYLAERFDGDIIFMSGVAGKSTALDEQDKRRNNRADTAMTSDYQMQVATHAIVNSVLKSVVNDKVNVIGYMHWALVDGYEFVTQHSQGWGLVAIDWTQPSRDRTIKPFGYWFSDLAEARGFQNREMACNPIPEQMEITPIKFSPDFIWATATASAQIEGAADEDGKGETIWDVFAATEGNVLNGDTPAVACDSYHQFERDIEMITQLGTNSYRFSIAWARIFPNGRASEGINQIGLDWYVNFVRRLIEEDIRPLVTLYHWDLPQGLEDTLGGWMDTSGELVQEYVNYADTIFEALSEAGVRDWITFNEPYVFCYLGYSNGDHAPGWDKNYLQCGHNMINAHTAAYHLFKQKYQSQYPTAKVGVTLNVNYVMSYKPQDPEAQIPSDIQFEFALKWLSDPIFGQNGDYSQAVKSIFGNLTETERFGHWVLPEFTEEEKLLNKGASDFFGLNFYNGNLMVGAAIDGLNTYLEMTGRGRIPDWMNCDEWWNGASHWLHHTPDHYRFMIRQLDRWYPGVEILGTENGVSGAPDWLDPETTMNDWWRKRQMVEYIGQAGRAIVEDQVNYIGYSEWSLMDNFEWGSGYTESFGLFRVDFNDPARPRSAKESVDCFNKIVTSNEVRNDWEECDWKHMDLIEDPLDHPELDYINRTSKMDYWDRDQVYYGSYNKSTFNFGAATAAYQIEGAWNEDGKGMNIWDYFSNYEQPATPEDEGQCLIARCETGNIACDSYHNVERDVAYAKALNLDQYRFSINWARILPEGKLTAPNYRGIGYYNRLIDQLIEAGIEPMITLFHWDLPHDLQVAYGGFNSSDIVDDFNNYADLCFELFGDRVTKWMTFNEPHSYCWQGHDVGGFPPRFGDAKGENFYRCAHNMILAHGKAYRTYERKYAEKHGGEVSITINAFWGEPRDPNSNDDVLAAQRYMVHQIAHWVDPLYYGDYPVELKNQMNKLAREEHRTVSRLPEFTAEEKEMLKGALDFYSLQMYSTRLVTTQADYTDPMRLCLDHYKKEKCQQLLDDDSSIDRDRIEELLYWFRPGWYGDMEIWTAVDPEWEKAESVWLRNTPWGLRRMINWIDQRYPDVGGIWITENGISLEERTADPDRYQYIYLHFNEMLKAIEIDGVNVRGTCIWSLMDNFEWIAGYHDNFGVYHVEFNSLPGQPAGSALPDTWDKTSVPRIANLIKNPIYVKPESESISGKFADDFVFGVSTRGVEVESNVGYGNSIWDEHKINPILERSNLWQPATTAANVQLYVQEDVEIMAELGMKSYSFTISWPKLVQDGVVNENYATYITQLCTTLRENSIKSVATIFNNDLPKDLPDSWADPAAIEAKLENEKYFELLSDRFGSLVDEWVSFENTQTEVILGLTNSNYPPASRTGEDSTLLISNAWSAVNKIHSQAYNVMKTENNRFGVGIEAFQYATPANPSSEIDIDATYRHNLLNIDLFKSYNRINNADFIIVDYETTGLVTKLDRLYNSTIPDFHPDFEMNRASQYSNDWTGQQGGKQSQRFIKNGLRKFLNDPLIKEILGGNEIYLKTRWTTTATSELYPIFTERDLLLGKNKRVDDSHRERVTKEWLQDIMKCQTIDGINVGAVFFDYIDSWGTPSASHFTNGLVHVDLNQLTSKRTVKNSARYISSVIKNGLNPSDLSIEKSARSENKEPSLAEIDDSSNTGLTIGLSVFGGVFFVAIVLGAVRKHRKRSAFQVDHELNDLHY